MLQLRTKCVTQMEVIEMDQFLRIHLDIPEVFSLTLRFSGVMPVFGSTTASVNPLLLTLDQ